MNKSRVYFAVLEDLSFVKIGYTTHLSSRISQIKTNNPQRLKISSIAFNTLKEAQKAEKEFHHKFKCLKVKGEWFHFTNEIAKEIQKVKFEYHRELQLNERLRMQAKSRLEEIKSNKIKIVKTPKPTIEDIKNSDSMHYANNGFKTYCGLKPGVDTQKWTMIFKDVNCTKCIEERNKRIKESKTIKPKTGWSDGIYR